MSLRELSRYAFIPEESSHGTFRAHRMRPRVLAKIEAAVRHGKVIAVARELGSPLHDPFMTLGFLALPVIPSLKLTDRGLVDVERFERVSLFVA